MSKVGTEANDIALHFITKTGGRATSSFISKSTKQAKSLLEAGYTKQEVIDVIDYITENKNVVLYSFGFVNATIQKFLPEMKAANALRLAKEGFSKPVQSEVSADHDSGERNKGKLHRFGSESRFGEKFDFHLFEGRESTS